MELSETAEVSAGGLDRDAAIVQAVDRSQAVIVFAPDGTILDANDAFLGAIGYVRSELLGQNHRVLMLPEDAATPEYARFWPELAGGQIKDGEIRRRRRNGDTIWLSAVYTPVLNSEGRTEQVIKFVRDVTDVKNAALSSQAVLDAFSRSQCVIEFDPAGTILTANDNFLNAVGYSLEELRGQHHSIFMPRDETATEAYAAFWADLAAGHFRSGEFRRIAKSGEPIWIAASYNPVLDASGKVARVVKIATDITIRRRAVDAMIQSLTCLSQGDLTTRIGQEISGEFTPMRDAFNSSVESLSALVSGIMQGSKTINWVTDTTRENAENLAQKAEVQAAAIVETKTALTQITEQVSVASDAAQDVDSKAKTAAEQSQLGTEIFDRTLQAIRGIEQITGEVSKITKVIESFAFQTNLLSINAAVEAARAGDAGRGFAVVATEVRNLAERSAEASKNIRDLTNRCAKEVSEGASLAQEAGERLKAIEDAAGSVAVSIEAIASGARDQAMGVKEVEKAVTTLDDNLQAISELSRQGASQAADLSREVDKFDAIVAGFSATAAETAKTSGTPPARAAGP